MPGVIERRQFNMWLPVEMVDTLVYGPFTETTPTPAPCASGQVHDVISGLCTAPQPEALSCERPTSGEQVGKPIIPATREKYLAETDWSDTGPAALSLTRNYRSTWGTDVSRTSSGLGQAWTHNHAWRLSAAPAGAPTAVSVISPEGYLRTFAQAAGTATWSATNSADTLTPTAGGWRYRRADDDATLDFNGAGQLQSLQQRNGHRLSYTYDGSGRAASVSNSFGRTLGLAHNSAGQLVTATLPGNRVIGYAYDAAGRLSTVTYPDGKSRSFVYENAAFPQALTGILDESGTRWGSFAYDAQGRAVSTELAGGVNRYQVSYPAAGTATVLDPLGTSRSYGYGTAQGRLAVTSGTLPSAGGEPDAASRVQDANGLITAETDFKGVRTDTVWDASRRLPTRVTEAAGTPEARTTTTQWHVQFSLPVLVTEVGRSTAYTYDAQGRMLTQSVTDTLATPNTTRNWRWTYNAQGLVATAQDPNGASTSYTYDERGNVLTETNVLGHVTRYSWDSANRLASQTEANGLVNSYTWDARDRLLTQTVGGSQTTTFTYHPTGTLATLTLPTGLHLSYSYDGAHRLTGWSNNRGQSGSYTLDALGNRVAHEVKNAGGAVAYVSASTINNINRVAGQTEGGSQNQTFGYDANGEQVSTTNALNQTTSYGLDALRRTRSITDAANATARLSYNALDGLTGASDFKGVATAYGRDALGNPTSESSPDSGSRSTRYDSLGLPQRIVDALGQATSITRDALGRPTQISYANGQSATLVWDAAGAGQGYLRQIQEPAGTTTYSRDAFGRVTLKTQQLANGSTQSVGYSYTAGGQLDTLTYPGGGQLKHLYAANGLLTGLNWNGQPLLTGIGWNALGQPTGWTWAFAGLGSGAVNQATSRSYDTAGRLTQVQLAGQTVLSMGYDAAGRIASFSQRLTRPSDPYNPRGSLYSELHSWSASYDRVGRLTGLNTVSGTHPAAASSSSFSYDANGNRTASSLTQRGSTTSRSYSVANGSNRLSGFSQTVTGSTTGTTTSSYAYNANGDLNGDGARGYHYDATGRLASVAQGSTSSSAVTRYAHNLLGQRVFKTEPLFPPQGSSGTALTAFFAKGWTPQASAAEQVGWAYGYDEDGTLLGEWGLGGAQSAGARQYVYLPTASGPLPVALIDSTSRWAIVADHLNTPRRLTRVDGTLEWQWALSAFGDEPPTIAGKWFVPGAATSSADFRFDLRYPGQTHDRESGLSYNYFRSYSASTGRYTQSDPIGLQGGWNRFGYVDNNPLNINDPLGLAPTCRWVGFFLICSPTPPLIDPEYPAPLQSGDFAPITVPSNTLPGAILTFCSILQTQMENSIMQMARNKKAPTSEDSLDDLSGHTKGKRPSTKNKHEKGDERRRRDRGGEKKRRKDEILMNLVTPPDLVRIVRVDDLDELICHVHQSSTNSIIASELSDSLDLDGFCILPTKTVRYFDRSFDKKNFYTAALGVRKQFDEQIFLNQLSSNVYSDLQVFESNRSTIAIHMEFDDPDVCYVGIPREVTSKKFLLDKISSHGIYMMDPLEVEVESITKIEFSTRYLIAVSHAAKVVKNNDT